MTTGIYARIAADSVPRPGPSVTSLALVSTLLDKQPNCVITRQHVQPVAVIDFYPRAAAVSPLHNP